MKIRSIAMITAIILLATACANKEIRWTENDSEAHLLYDEGFRMEISDSAEALGNDIIEQFSEPVEYKVCVDGFSSFTAEDGSAFVVKKYRIDQANQPFYTEIYYIENELKKKIAGTDVDERMQELVRGDDMLYFTFGNSIKCIDSSGKTEILVPEIYGLEDESYHDVMFFSCSFENNVLNVSYDLIPRKDSKQQTKSVTYQINCDNTDSVDYYIKM